MTITAYVQDDKITTYTPKEGGQTRTVRTLNCFDMDAGNRMAKPFRMTIAVNCPIAGDARAGASIRDCMITASISSIRVFEWDKGLGFDGQLLSTGARLLPPDNNQKVPK
jgi:hypothetical protein